MGPDRGTQNVGVVVSRLQGAVEGVSTPDTVFPSQQPFPHTAERLFGGLTVATPNDNVSSARRACRCIRDARPPSPRPPRPPPQTPKLGVPGPSRPAGGAGRSRLAPHASQAASDGQQPDASGSGSQQEDNADAPALDDVSNHYTQQQAQSNSQPRSAAGRHHDGRVGDERQQEHRSTRKGARAVSPSAARRSDLGASLARHPSPARPPAPGGVQGMQRMDPPGWQAVAAAWSNLGGTSPAPCRCGAVVNTGE
jgi:hypothetical protein